MRSRALRNLLHLLVGLSWLAQSGMMAPPAAALTLRPAQAQAYPCDGELLRFDGNNQGWAANPDSAPYAKLNPDVLYPFNAPEGGKSIGLDLDLEGDHPWAEFQIDLDRIRPTCAQDLSFDTAWWGEGSVLSLWVWAPIGTRGDSSYSNGLHLYAVDAEDRKIYGTWQTFQQNTWFEVTLKLGGRTPACSDPDPEFDFSRIRAFGLNISLNTDIPTPIHQSILISPLRIKSGVLAKPQSNHVYSFDAETNTLPQWGIVTDPAWGAKAFTQSAIQQGALVIDAEFRESDEPQRKGVMDLVFAPALHLRDLQPQEEFISLDLRFDPPPDLEQASCPFSLMLWAFDSGKKVQFNSINQAVGSGEWTRVSFRLRDLARFGQEGIPPPWGRRLDPSQIGKIGFQLYDSGDGYEYQGRVWVDNIAIGGQGDSEPPPELSFVTTNDSHFMLDGKRLRFVGANAEYLPYKPDATVEQVLDHARALGIRVLRTWGFGEGCEDYNLDSCEETSPYFQLRPGVYNDSAFEHFDRIVYEAGKRDIRLIVPLANNWHEYGGIPRYVCWDEQEAAKQDLAKWDAEQDAACDVRLMSDEMHDKFYTDTDMRSWYQEYVTYFVTHRNTITGKTYAEDPTIMAWELINEPRSKSDPDGSDLHQWIVDMSKFLGGLAPEQLIGTGEEGWYIMPVQATAGFEPWQVFHKNYWHYGVNWAEVSCTDDYGSNGTDFISDHRDKDGPVRWQERVDSGTLDAPAEEQLREGVRDVDFTGIHLYLSPTETGLSYAPYCYYYGLDSLCGSGFDTTHFDLLRGENDKSPGFERPVHQAEEWIRQHVKDAHETLRKPFLLEEFNFPVPPQNPLAPDGNQFQVTPDERARLFRQYLDLSYRLDVDGVMFWNLGYDGFMQQSWNEIQALKQWTTNSGGEVSNSDPDGIRLSYSHNPAYPVVSMQLSEPHVDWLRAEGNQVMVDLRNDGNARDVVVEVRLEGESIPRSKTIPIEPGENTFSISELFAPVEKLHSSSVCPMPKEDPPLVTGIRVTIQNFTSAGRAYFNFHSIFNNKYVIYPGDPVEEVIRTATARWEEGLEAVTPSVQITAESCKDIHAGQIVDGIVPIQFQLVGAMEHPDGYYYRYSIAGPRGQAESNFRSNGREQTGEISVVANAVGKYRVEIAPEGVPFDSSFKNDSAATCSFEVINAAPVFKGIEVQTDGRALQAYRSVLNPGLKLMQTEQPVQFSIAADDDTSARLKLGCRVLRDGEAVDEGRFPCQTQTVEITDLSEGSGYAIQGNLPPGQYEVQLWLDDEQSERSEISSFNIVIPNPGDISIGLVLCILEVLVVVFVTAWLPSLFSRRSQRKAG